MNKWVYLGTLLLLTSLVSPSYIIVTAQLDQPEPTTAHWYVQEGDAISWQVAKLRNRGNVTSTSLFYDPATGESLKVTEGNIITITVLTLGNAREYEGTCRIQTGEEQLSRDLVNTWIMPIYDRDYWINTIAWSENQTGVNSTLEGNLLIVNSYSPGGYYYKSVLNISTGLMHSIHSVKSNPSVIEMEINLITGFWLPNTNISLPTLLLAGVIGGEIIIAIYLVRLFRRRRAELS
ncbi:MAG: hypothetical protein ACFFCZ_29630 [Promethearchaeota archaeon]